MPDGLVYVAIVETLKKIIGLSGDRLNAKLPREPTGLRFVVDVYETIGTIEKSADELALILGISKREPFRFIREQKEGDPLQRAHVALRSLSKLLAHLAPGLEIFAPDLKKQLDRAWDGEAEYFLLAGDGLADTEKLQEIRSLATEAKAAVRQFIVTNYGFRDFAP